MEIKEISSLQELLSSDLSIMGEELEALIQNILNSSEDEKEKSLALDLWERYYNPETASERVTSPLPKAYYYLWMGKEIVESGERDICSLSRDIDLSPRGAEFFDPENNRHNNEEGVWDVLMTLRDVLRYRVAIDGEDLFNLCNATITTHTSKVSGGYPEYQQQLAHYILDTFYADKNKCPKSGVYYRVTMVHYGQPKVYRDKTLSPRTKHAPSSYTSQT